MKEKIERIKYLVPYLREVSRKYYQPVDEEESPLSDHDYDKLYNELKDLEKETGFVMADSPTQTVEPVISSKFEKEVHSVPMLSLERTKSIEDLLVFLGDREGVLSLKEDGLTIVNTFEGDLIKSVTRGNDSVGEVVTHNVRTFKNIPTSLAYSEQVIVRGEAIIKYSTFKKINSEREKANLKLYKTPRNLAAGTVRQLNAGVTKLREMYFHAFRIVSAEGMEFNTVSEQYEWLKSNGFDVVEYVVVNKHNLRQAIESFREKMIMSDIPSDGLVLALNDIRYAESLGRTEKVDRHSIAFKWEDDETGTQISDIIWQVGRTGKITPVAVFEPIDIDGTSVERASLHNVDIFESMEIGIGDTVTVYKANMIIPQIADNLTRSNTEEIPDRCPVCGGYTETRVAKDARQLYCTNDECPAKTVRKLKHFVSKEAMNIEGLSGETLEKLMDMGLVEKFSDIFKLHNYEEEIVNNIGFGYRSFEKMIDAINVARNTTMARFINSLGIPNVGLDRAKLLCKHYKNDLLAMAQAEAYELWNIEGVGEVVANSFSDYFYEEENWEEVKRVYSHLYFNADDEVEQVLSGLVFVCTGALYRFKDRPAMKELLEKLGGKLSGSISGRTDYLITNDTTSGTHKNIEAQNLGVSIITEDELIEKFNLYDYI